MTPLPSFYRRRAVSEDAAILAEGEGFFVSRKLGVISLVCLDGWRPEFEEVYRQSEANSVRLGSTARWAGPSLAFLQDLSGLRGVSLRVDAPVDLSPLADLGALESLELDWNAPGPVSEFDFRRLDELLECSISWHPSFGSALEVESLRLLTIVGRPSLKDLDLRRLPRIAEVDLISCSALRQIQLHEAARLQALELTRCGKFRPDWERISADLRYLALRGRIGFAVEELAGATALEFLWAELPTKQSSWTFLRELPSLNGLWFLDLKIPKAVADVVRSINQARGHGPTLAARPG